MTLSITRCQAVARIADRTASQHLWESRVTWRHRSRDHLIHYTLLHMSFSIQIETPCRRRQTTDAPIIGGWNGVSISSRLSVLESRVWPFRVKWRHRSH